MGEFIIAAKSLILFDKKVLLLQYSGNIWKVNENRWGFVGGCLEFGEELLEGLAREIHEETGLTTCVDRLIGVSTHVPTSPTQLKQFVYLYYLSYANTGEVKLSEEHKDYLWANRKQIIELVDKPVLNDIITNKMLDMLDIE